MALDDQVRKNADALAKELGLDIQQAFGRFLDDVLAQVTKDQDALQAQADQAVAEAEARAEVARAAVAATQAEAEAQKTQAVAAAKEESAAAVQAAVTQTREHVAREAAGLVARAREEAAQANVALQADRDARRGLDEEAAALRASAEQGSLAAMERLLDAFRRLDQATTLTALIDALAEAAAGETTRSAVFVVRGREVRGWRVAGFTDAPADVRLVSVALDAAGAIGVCVRIEGPGRDHARDVRRCRGPRFHRDGRRGGGAGHAGDAQRRDRRRHLRRRWRHRWSGRLARDD